MNQEITDLKQQRLQKLFEDCQQQVISQIIGPFGLSLAMFEDRDGGNVTTLHNFSREDADYIAEKDKSSYGQSIKNYDREEYSSTIHCFLLSQETPIIPTKPAFLLGLRVFLRP